MTLRPIREYKFTFTSLSTGQSLTFFSSGDTPCKARAESVKQKDTFILSQQSLLFTYPSDFKLIKQEFIRIISDSRIPSIADLPFI
jgi:hypothetical protein